MDGGAREVIASYMTSYAGEQVSGSDLTSRTSRLGSGKVRYTRIEFLGEDGTPCAMIRSGDALTIRFHFHAESTIRDPSFGFQMFSALGTLITETSHRLNGIQIDRVGPGDGYIDLEIDSLNLIPGRYQLALWITAPGGKPIYDGDVQASLEIDPTDVYKSGRLVDSKLGLVYFPQRWNVSKA